MLKIRTENRRSSDAHAPLTLLLTRRVTFAAAHVLRRAEWDEERNRAVFGACAGDHGHNYVLEVSVAGEPDPETGMVVNLRDLDLVVREAVVQGTAGWLGLLVRQMLTAQEAGEPDAEQLASRSTRSARRPTFASSPPASSRSPTAQRRPSSRD